MGYYGFFTGYLRVNYGFGKTGVFSKRRVLWFFMGFLWDIYGLLLNTPENTIVAS